MTLKHPFHEIAISSDGKYLFGACFSSLQKFDLSTGALLATFNIQSESSKPKDEKESSEPKSKKPRLEETDTKEQKQALSSISGEGPKSVRTLSLSRNGEYVIAVTTDNKNVYILKSSDLSVVSKRKFSKRPSAVSTTFDDERLIIADKFGDIYDVPLTSNEPVIKPSDGETEDVADIEPILGHVSMLTDVELVRRGEKKYILSADRDEHIRVTRYPQSYIIERWLFGHDEFVAQLFVPSWAPEYLVSGGGDNYVAVFKWTEDKTEETSPLKSKFPIREHFEKYLTKEFHQAPRRKKDTEEPKGPLEISVDKILGIEQFKQIIIHVEATNAIIVAKLSDDGQLTYLSTFDRPDTRIVSVSTSASGKILLSLESTTDAEAPLLEVYETSESGELKKVESEAISKINETASYEIANKDKPEERVTLYSVKNLRKRGEH